MEAIKINVGVTIDFSDSVRNFITALFTPASSERRTLEATKTVAERPAAFAPQAPAKSSEKPAPVETASATPAPTPAQPVAPAPSSVSIEDVRAALSAKVNDHRQEIKAKLSELGAPSVTKLDPSKYEEMLNFLNSL